MKKRRIFTTVLLMAVTGLIFSTFYSCMPAKKNLGLQLYSVRDSIVKNVPGTIAKISKMGYKFVEPAGYADGKLYGMDPAAFKALCAKNNLTIISSHVGQALPDSAH